MADDQKKKKKDCRQDQADRQKLHAINAENSTTITTSRVFHRCKVIILSPPNKRAITIA